MLSTFFSHRATKNIQCCEWESLLNRQKETAYRASLATLREARKALERNVLHPHKESKVDKVAHGSKINCAPLSCNSVRLFRRSRVERVEDESIKNPCATSKNSKTTVRSHTVEQEIFLHWWIAQGVERRKGQ